MRGNLACRGVFRAKAQAVSCALCLLAVIGVPARGESQVFSGDPIDRETGAAYSILPGVPLVYPGKDEDFGGGDDLIDGTVIGDVDLVLRSGGAYGGGPIPPGADGVAAAPLVGAGGVATGVGGVVPFQVILSDGAVSPPTGNRLTGAAYDRRPALIMAYADLDGDGFVGPTDVDGAVDDQIERQEALVMVGRQVALFDDGVAAGSLGVSLGAPASRGGLGLVLVAGALLGEEAPGYFDGPWAATLLPLMPPIDPTRIIGRGNVRPADPEFLVEIELEVERVFLPAPGHPLLGTPYAIPTDGSSVTVDLARSESGAATGIGLAVVVDPASFVADPARRLIPAVGAQGVRVVLESVASLTLADDGPGGGRVVVAFVSDLLGNAADPGEPMRVTFDVGTGLRIVSPDGDGDPLREEVSFDSAELVQLLLDDSAGSNDSGSAQRLIALVDGEVSASLRIALAPGPPQSPSATATMSPTIAAPPSPSSSVSATDTPTALPSPATATATAPPPTGTAAPTSTVAATASPSGSATTATPVATSPTPRAPTPTRGPASCVGDCDSSGQVTIAELVRAVGIALNLVPLDACPTIDRDGDDTASVAELIAAVRRALDGCGGAATLLARGAPTDWRAAP